MNQIKVVSSFIGLILGLSLQSSSAFAWGVVGHHTSAQIAYNILQKQNSPALNEVKKILNNDDFVLASTWADEIKGSKTEDWSQTKPYHYESLDDNDKFVDHLKTQPTSVRTLGGVVEGILASETVIRDPNSSADDKNHALKFMMHFIGDVHQPLHTGRIADRGGNDIPVKWLSFNVNLHQVWDTQIIALGHKDVFSSGTQPEQIAAYANLIQKKFETKKYTDENILTYNDWVNESMVPRADAYKYKDEDANTYTARFIDTVDEQIYKAGVRMAFTMNRLFPGYTGPDKATSQAQVGIDSFKHDIESIVGSLSSFINLKPSPIK